MFDKKAYMKEYNKKHSEEQKQWCKCHPLNMIERRKRFKERHPNYHKVKRQERHEKIAKYNAEYRLIKSKEIKSIRKSQDLPKMEQCEFCGSYETLQKHHPDYDYPLIYVTCCVACHKWVHNNLAIEVQP